MHDHTAAADDTGSGEQAATDELRSEREHLQRAGAALAAMRVETAAMTDAGADELTSYSLGELRARRLVALADDPAVASGRKLPGTDAPPPMFFGRLDWSANTGGAIAGATGTGGTGGTASAAGAPDEPPSHIGRRNIREQIGTEPLVIDWRASIARVFYRATTADPMGVRRRRRFGFAGGELTSFEDEILTGTAPSTHAPDAPAEPAVPTESRILREEIERPRVGPMRDIVATIQPDQDDLVRADLDQSICVQGAPGTGKTAVGLHRAAYLLYTHPERLRRGGVLVVGPNAAFLRYIAAVLPALGEIDVTQLTVDQLVAGRVTVRGTDDPQVARLKGDPRLARVLHRAVYGRIARPEEPVVVPVGARRHRVAPELLRRWVDDLRRGDTHYAPARDRLHALVAQEVRRQWEERGGAPSDRETRAIARARPVREAVDALWPPVDPAALVASLLSDPDTLAAAADGLLDADEQAALRWERPPRSPRGARWSPADAVLVDEVAALLERTAGFGHVVLDEAQDLSAMQCRAVGRRAAAGSVTVLGDLAQATTPWAVADWASTLAHLGHPQARIEPLTRGYRVPGEVLVLANRLLPHLATGVAPATSVRRGEDALSVRRVDADLPSAVLARSRAALAREGSVGVLCADPELPVLSDALSAAGIDHDVLGAAGAADDASPRGHRLSLVAAGVAKGLEFDHVVLVEPAEIARGGRHGLARLYVALTRAVTSLDVVHHAPLPAELTGELPGEPTGELNGELNGELTDLPG